MQVKVIKISFVKKRHIIITTCHRYAHSYLKQKLFAVSAGDKFVDHFKVCYEFGLCIR